MAKEYSAIERARNAAKQARDKNGRFIEMNGTMRYKSGGKTKSGTIIGVSGGYAYFLPPIKNANHRPMPYRIPLSALEMYKPKATLKDKKDVAAEKKYIREQTKLFESKLDPNRRKEQADHTRIVKQAKKEKLDVDRYEVDEDGVEHFYKDEAPKADPKVQAQVNAVVNSLSEKDSFQIPLEDGFSMEVQRINGKINTKVLDSEGNIHSGKEFSEKKTNNEIAQEIAKDVARENNTRDVGEEIIVEVDPEDIDGDGIPDISDPNVSPDFEKVTEPTNPAKEELDVAPKGTILISEDENVIYSKSARRTESEGSQWNRYIKKGESYVLDRDDLYSKDIADGATFKRGIPKTKEQKKESVEAKQKETVQRTEKEQRRHDINSVEKNVKGPNAVRGILPIDEDLLDLLPESVQRDPDKPDNVMFPKGDFSAEKLDMLPVGTQVSVVQRNGSVSRVTKLPDGTWFSKKRYKDKLTGMDQHILTTEEVFNDMGDMSKVRASTKYRRNKDKEDALFHSGAQRRAYEYGRSKKEQMEIDEEDKKISTGNYFEGGPTTVGSKEEAEAQMDVMKASNDHPAYTEYKLTKESGEGGNVYRKMPDGTVVNVNIEDNPQEIFDSAEDFAEVFAHRGTTLMYSFHLPEDLEDDVKSTDLIEPLGYDETSIPKPTTPKSLPVRRNQNKIESGTRHVYTTTNPIRSITGLDGVEYELGDSRAKRMNRIADLFQRGLIDVEDFRKNQYKALFEAEEGEETGRVYHDGTPIRIGDEVLYRTGYHERDVNAKDDYVEVRSIVVGRVNGKDDLMIIPVAHEGGKARASKGGATVWKTIGPETALGKKGAMSVNLNTVRRTTDDGFEQQGNRNPTNVDGRSGNFDLGDLYSQDGTVLGKDDEVQFRIQSREYNTDGIPYNDVLTGRIISINRQNQSFSVYSEDVGKVLHPSIKNTTSIDGPEPIPEPRIQDELELPEGLRLDSQNRILSEDSAIFTEEVRDSLNPNRTGINQDSESDSASSIPPPSEEDLEEAFGDVETDASYNPSGIADNSAGEAKKDSEIFGEPEDKPKPEPRKKRNLINSVVNTDQEYDSSIPRYFRDRKENEYGSDAEKATDWSNAPVGSTIRLKGGGFAIKTTVDSWDFRKSSKHLVQRRLSNKKFAETLVNNPEFLENARTTAPTRKKFLEYNGGKLSPTAKPSARKAPTGSEVEVEGDKLTKTDSGWEGEQGVILSDKQLDKIMVENPEDYKVTKVSVSKVATDKKSVAIQDSIFDLNDDGTFSRNDVFSSEPKETISAEEVDTVAGEMSQDFNMVVKDKKNNSEDSWEDIDTVSLDSDGNIVLSLDDSSEQTAKQVIADFSSRLEGSAVPPRRIVLDESEHFQTVSAYAKPNPDGGYDLVVNPDGVEEKDIASALADGIRQNNATARGMSLRDYDKQVLDTLVSEEDRSLSYDEILKKLGIRSKRKGSVVAEAFADVWENGPDASPVHLNIWKRYASDNEMIALFRKDNGRDPRSDSELDKYRKKL